MTLLEILKLKETWLGIEAPLFAWWAALVLLVVTLGALFWLIIRVLWVGSPLKSTAKQLREIIKNAQLAQGSGGLPVSTYDQIRQVFHKKNESLGLAWSNFSAHLIIKRNENHTDGYYSPESAGEDFCDATLLAPRMNRAFYTAMPSIITGTGLLCTFVALLIALMDVKFADNRIAGLEHLIQGLSGKFVSSIAALFAATVYIPLEKWLLRRPDHSRRQLVRALDQLFPRLSTAHVVVELQRDLREQSNALQHLSGDFASRLKSGLSENIEPTLVRMADAIDGLNEMLRASKAQEQQSITGSLDTLLRNLQDSMARSIERMGSQFAEALSGSAMQQFNKVAASLAGTAQMFESMNAQSKTTQAMLQELVSSARNSTVEQMQHGKRQAEEMSSKLARLFQEQSQATRNELNELLKSAGEQRQAGAQQVQELATLLKQSSAESIAEVSASLKSIVQELTIRVGESSTRTTDAARLILQQAGEWTSRSNEQFARLLEGQGRQMSQIQEARSTLDSSLRQFKEALGHHVAVISDWRRISEDMKQQAAEASTTTSLMSRTQQAMEEVSSRAARQIEQLGEATRKQQEAWQGIENNMRRYQQRDCNSKCVIGVGV